VRVRAGDYQISDLEQAVDRTALVGNIVDHWMQLAEGRRTVAFAVSIDHSKNIASRFREAGVAAEHLDGNTSMDERDAILARLERGETRVVVNCNVLCEGWDQPSVKCAILARPTKSTGLYLQQAGRILRPWEGQSALILDHAGCAVEHGLPQEERTFSLAAKDKQRRGSKPVKGRACPSCHAVIAIQYRECPACGAKIQVNERAISEQEGKLVAVTSTRERHACEEWEKLRRIAAREGHEPGWAYHRFKEMFGRLPPAWGEGKRRPGVEERSPAWSALKEEIDRRRCRPRKRRIAHGRSEVQSTSPSPDPGLSNNA